MKRELRIIDGMCKVVNIDKKGNIINVVRDYQKPKIGEWKIREYEESEKIRVETEIKLAKQEKEIKKRKVEIAEEEKIHEIHHGKIRNYQRYDNISKEINPTMKSLLQRKVALGIIAKTVLNIKSSKELLDDWARKRHFYDYEEYLNIVALGRGFTCYEEYVKTRSYYPGMPNPIKENRMDNKFIGVYIGENGITKIYEGSKRMPYNHPGYDIICQKGYKIDVKSTVLSRYNTFSFGIQKNRTADYFALVGFNNIIELTPLHLWIIKSDENIHGRQLKELGALKIIDEPQYIQEYQKYENLYRLEMLKSVCKDFDGKNKIDVKDYNVTTRGTILDIIFQIRTRTIGNISPIDILLMLEKKKKETIGDRLEIIPNEDVKSMRYVNV